MPHSNGAFGEGYAKPETCARWCYQCISQFQLETWTFFLEDAILNSPGSEMCHHLIKGLLRKLTFWLGGETSNILGIFTPILGEDLKQFDERAYFQRGGSTNHQRSVGIDETKLFVGRLIRGRGFQLVDLFITVGGHLAFPKGHLTIPKRSQMWSFPKKNCQSRQVNSPKHPTSSKTGRYFGRPKPRKKNEVIGSNSK